MTIEEAIKNRENCLEYLEKSGPLATKENVQAVRLSLEALREKAEREKNAPLTREKLVELLRYADDSCVNTGCMECSHMKRGRSCKAYFYADYLLAGGVTVRPLQVGDTVFQTDGVNIYESTVKKLVYDAGPIDFDEEAIGKSVFLTREEAEEKRRRFSGGE